MNKQEITDYLYSFNAHADITVEEIAENLASEPEFVPSRVHIIPSRYHKDGTTTWLICCEPIHARSKEIPTLASIRGTYEDALNTPNKYLAEAADSVKFLIKEE